MWTIPIVIFSIIRAHMKEQSYSLNASCHFVPGYYWKIYGDFFIQKIPDIGMPTEQQQQTSVMTELLQSLMTRMDQLEVSMTKLNKQSTSTQPRTRTESASRTHNKMRTHNKSVS